MRMTLVLSPTFMPLELETLKARPEIRALANDQDDSILGDMLRSAIDAYEEYTERILCRSTWNIYLDAFPAENADIITPAPLHDVVGISYLDTDGVDQTLAAATYVFDGAHKLFGRISLAYEEEWPDTLAQANAVVAQVELGYPTPSAIPQRIKDGLIAKIQELYDGVDRSGAYEDAWIGHREVPI